MVEECPRCGLAFESEEGYWLGAIIINTLLSGAIIALLIALGVGLTPPDVPALPMIVVGLPLGIALPIAVYPISKTLWVAVDSASSTRSAHGASASVRRTTSADRAGALPTTLNRDWRRSRPGCHRDRQPTPPATDRQETCAAH